MRLYGYFRSSAAYRVRIALNLKGITVEHLFRHLRKGEQRSADYLPLNPQGLVPSLLLDDGTILTQSLAIIEYLDETHPEPRLVPADPVRRAKVRAFAQAIACEIHAVQNLKVLNRVKALGHGQEEANAWAHDIIAEGLAACEALIARESGPFCFGASPTMADLALVPQLYNARRFDVDLKTMPRLLAAEAACQTLPAFAAAAPEHQPDAE
jgi:maleylpyruvate isomerase